MDQVYIANLALQKIGAKRLIASLNENSPESVAVLACYGTIRDEVLCENPWTFAQKRAILAQRATPPVFTDDGCSVAYSLPSDCLKPNVISDSTALWKLEADANGEQILVSDTSGLKLGYTFRNDNPDTYRAKFITAFACRLAAELCFHISESVTKAKDLRDEYSTLLLPQAIAEDSQPGSPIQPIQDEWEQGRYVGPVTTTPGQQRWPSVFS